MIPGPRTIGVPFRRHKLNVNVARAAELTDFNQLSIVAEIHMAASSKMAQIVVCTLNKLVVGR
jgi:hypothetical protein